MREPEKRKVFLFSEEQIWRTTTTKKKQMGKNKGVY
jgi:hypothetical protein